MGTPVSAAADLVVSLAYLAISLTILRPLVRTGQVRSNKLGTATALIFFTCSVGHGLHVVHAALPALGLEPAGQARPLALHDVAWSVFTAGVGVKRSFYSLNSDLRYFLITINVYSN